MDGRIGWSLFLHPSDGAGDKYQHHHDRQVVLSDIEVQGPVPTAFSKLLPFVLVLGCMNLRR